MSSKQNARSKRKKMDGILHDFHHGCSTPQLRVCKIGGGSIQLPSDIVTHIFAERLPHGAAIVSHNSLLFKLMTLSTDWALYTLSEILRAIRYHHDQTRRYILENANLDFSDYFRHDKCPKASAFEPGSGPLSAQPSAESQQIRFVSTLMRIQPRTPSDLSSPSSTAEDSFSRTYAQVLLPSRIGDGPIRRIPWDGYAICAVARMGGFRGLGVQHSQRERKNKLCLLDTWNRNAECDQTVCLSQISNPPSLFWPGNSRSTA